jgi:hypothetical protein
MEFSGKRILLALALSSWVGLLTSPAQTSSATSQIGPGNSGSISHVVGPATGGQPKKMLDGALTPETRQTLQEAMNSSGPDTSSKSTSSHEVTIGPGEGAKLDGAKAEKVSYSSLPAPVRNALGNGVQHNLDGSKSH